MENQDIFNQFKKAADNAESPNFASMEKVWQRVEEKLDKKELKSTTLLWKKWAVAASILLAFSIGFQFLKDDPKIIKTNETITKKDEIKKITQPNNAIVVSETKHPDIKAEADQILHDNISGSPQVAVLEESIMNSDEPQAEADDKVLLKPVPAASQGYFTADEVEAKTEKAKDVELFMNKENKVSSVIKKQKPLVVYDNKVTNKQSVKEVEMEEIESIVELKEPLYIINGVEYTEEQLFGPKPTSPYAPLDQQDIDSISILQDEKAISIYGEKGKKGVVIISTKNGKPTPKKSK